MSASADSAEESQEPCLRVGEYLRQLKEKPNEQLASILGAAVVFTLLNYGFLRPWQLSDAAYHDSTIVFGAIRDVFEMSPRSVTLLGVCGFLLLNKRSLLVRWGQLDRGQIVRVIVGVAAVVLAWSYSTYQYNHFFGRMHGIDRILLFSLGVGTLLRPVMVFPLLLVLWPVAGQFNNPLGGFSWAISFLPARIILLFWAALMVNLATRKWETLPFRFLLPCIVAAHYLPSGLGKLRDGWLLHDQLYYLLPNTYANGWLGFLDASTIDQITRTLALATWPLKVFTLVVECGCIFLLWRKHTLQWFLAFAMAFHLGVFLVSGICFWPWLVIEATIFILVGRENLLDAEQFQPRFFALSVALIVTSPWWVNAVGLVWIDSPATYTYRVTAVGQSGKQYAIPPEGLAPYDYQFTLGGFHYLSREPIVPVGWGATNLTTFQRLHSAASAEELLQVEQEDGRLRFDPARSEVLRHFISTYFRSLNEHGSEPRLPRILSAPRHLWTYPRQEPLPEPVRQVCIEQVFSAFLNGSYQEIRSRPMLSVDVPAE